MLVKWSPLIVLMLLRVQIAVAAGPVTQRIDLKQGYNLVSFQVGSAAGYSIDEFMGSIQSVGEVIGVWGFQAWAEPWEGDDPRIHAGVQDHPHRLFPGRGYVVQVSGDAVLELVGPRWDGPVELSAGWNLIGIPGTSTDKLYVYEPDSVFGSKLDRLQEIVSIEAGVQPDASHFTPGEEMIFTGFSRFEPGRAYWLRCAEPVSLHARPSIQLFADSDNNQGDDVVEAMLQSAIAAQDASEQSHHSRRASRTARRTSADGLTQSSVAIESMDQMQFDSDSDEAALVFKNEGLGVYSWSIQEEVDWLEPSAVQGAVGSEPAVVRLRVKRRGMPVGTRNARIVIESGGREHYLTVVVDNNLAVEGPEDTSYPVGYTTLSVQANSFNYLALNMVRPVIHQGRLHVSESNRLVIVDDDDALDFSVEIFDTHTHYLEVLSGAFAGLHVDIVGIGPQLNSIQLASRLPDDLLDGARYVVRKHWTIADVFGANNEAGLKEGSASTGDVLLLRDSKANDGNGAFRRIYFSRGTLFGEGWREVGTGSQDLSREIIPYGQGFLIQSRDSLDKQIRLLGDVKIGPTILPINTGFNYISNLDPSGTQTLGELGLVPGLQPGSASTGDLVLVPIGEKGGGEVNYDQYYYSLGTLFGEGWRRVGSGSQDQSQAILPGGSLYLIQRRGADTRVAVSSSVKYSEKN